MIKAGVSLKDIINGGLEGALNLAVAGNLNLADAAEVASTALNAFRGDNITVAHAADILAGAANASATDVGEMRQGLAQVAAVASSAGVSFQDTATALAVLAQNGIKGSDAGTSLKTMLLRLTPTTKKAREEMEKLGIITKDGTNKFYDAKGALKDFASITDVLSGALDDLNPQQRAKALKTMFGTDAYRAGAVFFKEAADGINDMWDAMSDVTAAEVAKTKMDSLIGDFEKFKGELETLGITVGEEFLPTFREIVQGAEDLVHWFSELNPALYTTGLKSAGAAAGVALVASSVTKLYRASRLLKFTPTGLVITGLSLLAGAIIGVHDSVKRMNEVNLDSVKSLQKQHDTLSDNIDAFDKLKLKNQLSNDEMARFVDINSKLQKTADPQTIKDLKDAQAKLLKKSGLTNGEMKKFIDLNKKIAKKVPSSNSVLTEQGNILLRNTDAAKRYNAEQRKEIILQLRAAKAKLEANRVKTLNKEKNLLHDIRKIKQGIDDTNARITKKQSHISDLQHRYQIALKKGNTAKANSLKFEISREKQILHQQKQSLTTQYHDLLAKKKSLKATRSELKKLGQVKHQMVRLYLQQVGLNAKKGEGLKVINETLKKDRQRLRELEKIPPKQRKNHAGYQKSVEKIREQISKLEGVKSQIEQITGKAARMNSTLGRDIYKNVNVEFTTTGAYSTMGQIRAIQRLRRHQGGTFERPKFHEGGSPALRWDRPMSNEVDVRLLRNEMVLTEAQQASLFRLFDRAVPTTQPASQTVSAADIAEALRGVNDDRPINLSLSINGRQFARATADDMSEALDEKEARKRAAGGEL